MREPLSAAPRILTGSTEELLDQVVWFNRLRLVAAAGMVALAGFAHVIGLVAEPLPLYALAALTLLVDLVYMRRVETLRRVSAASLRRHVDMQIGVDLLILTAILHYSGGVTNPLVLFYLFHVFIAALLRSVRAALVVVAASVVLVAALALLERYAVLDHHPLAVGLMDLRTTDLAALGFWLIAFTATAVLSVYFLSDVLAQLVKRESQLADLDKQLAHSEKLASVGNLAAGVAHEINNPVGVIQSRVQILRYRIADGEAREALLQELDTIEKHARRIGGITDGLLTFSRETPFELRSLDLRPLVEEGVDLVAVPFKNAGVMLEKRLPRVPILVLGSPNHLLQVLVNIMLNAKDASAAGTTVTVTAEPHGDLAGIRIEDRGEGIAPDNLSKIFDPFFTTKDVGRGTGLGLAISHGIVERHGGRIEVTSDPGRGSTFTIWLPRAVTSSADGS